MLFALLLLAAPPSSQEALREIAGARQQAVRGAVSKFDQYVDLHPEDAAAAVERCKLIREAADSDDDDGCLRELAGKHPRSAAAILYRFQSLGLTVHIREALADAEIAWTDQQRAAAYAGLARRETGAASAADARKAMSLDPSIDLTWEIARHLFAEDRRAEGIAVLGSRSHGGDTFNLFAEVRLLVAQKAYARALWLFNSIEARGSLDPLVQAEMLAGAGKPAEAAKLYEAQRDRREEILNRLLPIYVSLNDQPAALHAYEELRDSGWKKDPLALRRLSLARHFPRARFRTRDLSGLFALLCALACVALLPALFLVPLHYWSLWRRLRGPPLLESPRSQRWGFRQVWLGCAFAALSQALFFLPLDQSLDSWTGLPPSDDLGAAFSGVFGGYVVAAALITALLLAFRSDRFQLLGLGVWKPGKAAAQIALTLLLCYATAFVSFRLIPAAGLPSTEQLIGVFLRAHGFWVALLSVAVVIPLFEELLFRSLLLELYTRWLGFFRANLFQAIAFAVLHGDPRRLPFYFVFGLLLGRLRRKSNGMLCGVLVHAINNAVVVIALNAAAGQGQLNLTPLKPSTPFTPSRELLSCASSGTAKGRLEDLKASSSAVALNNLAWQFAIEPGTSADCLGRAEELMETALTRAPDNPGWMDTEATVLYREGKLTEAIDLESAAMSLSHGNSSLATQLDRFVRKRQQPLIRGDLPVLPALAVRDGNLNVDLRGGMPYGGKLLVRLSGSSGVAGFMDVELGANHQPTYETPVPAQAKSAELVFADARGCDVCKPDSTHFFFTKPDPEVATYP